MLLASIASSLSSLSAAAEDPFGLYVGGAVGAATLRSGNVPYLQALLGTIPTAFSARDTGWKAVIGVRPLRMAQIQISFRSA
jgi:hypothetical protein